MRIDPLARTFFARFFENDVSGNSADLRNSFFWLIAFLAAPGALLPVMMSFTWDGIALGEGTDFLRIVARADKVLYLGFAMIASGFISAVTWSSLLLDRRDSLILGTLPVPGWRIVRAKLLALFGYVVAVAIGTHAAASVMYGFFLGTHNTLAFAGAGIVAHMIASCCASAFVLFAVTALQGLLFTALGPRRFMALSPWLQSAVVCVVLIGLILLPTISASTVTTLGGTDHQLRGFGVRAPTVNAAHPWILNTPMLWFLGLYEVILGTSDSRLIGLSLVALTALAGAIGLTVVSYPIAYRRLASTVVEMSTPVARHAWAARAVEAIVGMVSRNSITRAASQFFLTAIRRSTRHRLVAAVSIGVTLSAISPTLFRWTPRLNALPSEPTLDLLALPLEVMLFVLVGLRIAAALPADLPSGWMVDSTGAPTAPMRSGLWRTMFVAVVVPVSLLTLLAYWRAWGDRLALMHATLCMTVGGMLIEMLLWGFDGLPCGRPWRPEHVNARTWWPAYLGLFLVITGGLPWIERLCYEERAGFTVLIVMLVAAAIVLRVTHRRRRIMPDEDIDEPASVQVLNLD